MKTILFEKALELLQLSQNKSYKVLDLGCGTGDFLNLLSHSINKKSHLIGYDAMEKPIARAQLKYPHIEFMHHTFSDKLPFLDAYFDIVVSIDTIECIKNKKKLVEEIHRILKSSGQVLAMHWDWDTQTYAIPSKPLARKAVQAFSDWKQPWMDEADGQMGRKLWGLFEGSGKFNGIADAFCLLETDYKAGKYGYDRAQEMSELVKEKELKKSEYQQFLQEITESSKKGEYFYSVTSFIYIGHG